jgi:hypothetical protein
MMLLENRNAVSYGGGLPQLGIQDIPPAELAGDAFARPIAFCTSCRCITASVANLSARTITAVAP